MLTLEQTGEVVKGFRVGRLLWVRLEVGRA